MVRDQLQFPTDERLPVTDELVLRAMRTVPRHEFVLPPYRDRAYEDRPLGIGHGQTISQPYMVAYMTQLLEPKAGEVMLEVGTGSGYQAAVLAEIVDKVYSIEIVEPLGRQAAETLSRLGYDNVECRIGDGYQGWPEHGPFDGIVVTAAPESVPQPLIDQLKIGARLVIPVGPQRQIQSLKVLEKQQDGTVQEQFIMGVKFVPMTGDR